ncbi:hypothetical protein [Acidithiobacillus sp.]
MYSVTRDRQKLLQHIDALCPYPVPAATRERWLDSVLKTDPDRAMWHINRAFSHSGSEIGVLVAAREGNPDPFNRSDREIVGGMLMVFTPEPPTPVMRRGIDLEPIILNMILAGDWLKDQGFDPRAVRVEKVDTPEVMAWEHDGVPYSGNPDVVVRVVPKTGKPLVIVVDAKAPADVNDVPYDAYAIQVDHYRWGLEKHGIHTDLSAVGQLDLSGWKLHLTINDPASYAKNVKRIQEAAGFYHHHYLSKGILPDWTMREVMALSDDDPRRTDAEALSMRYLAAKIAADAAKRTAEEAQKAILDLFEGDILPKSLALRDSGLVKASTSEKIDEDRLAALFLKITGKSELPQKPVTQTEPDWDIVKSVLTAQGVPDSAYMKQSTRFLTPTGKSPTAIVFGELKESTAYRMATVLEAVASMTRDAEDQLALMPVPEKKETAKRAAKAKPDEQPTAGRPVEMSIG